MRGRKWTESPHGHGRKTRRTRRRRPGESETAAGMPGYPSLAASRAGPLARHRMAASGGHPLDLFSSYLCRLCECGDQAAVALRDELTDPDRMGMLGLKPLGPDFARRDGLAGQQ